MHSSQEPVLQTQQQRSSSYWLFYGTYIVKACSSGQCAYQTGVSFVPFEQQRKQCPADSSCIASNMLSSCTLHAHMFTFPAMAAHCCAVLCCAVLQVQPT
jgi:hypothetical protein